MSYIVSVAIIGVAVTIGAFALALFLAGFINYFRRQSEDD